MMPLRKHKPRLVTQARDYTVGTAKQLQARSRYLGHLAAAQGYRAVASAEDLKTQTDGMLRRYPLRVVAMVAALAGVLGFSIFRRQRR